MVCNSIKLLSLRRCKRKSCKRNQQCHAIMSSGYDYACPSLLTLVTFLCQDQQLTFLLAIYTHTHIYIYLHMHV